MGNDRWVQLFAKTVTKRFITLRMRRSRRYTEHAADNASVILKKSKKRKKRPETISFRASLCLLDGFLLFDDSDHFKRGIFGTLHRKAGVQVFKNVADIFFSNDLTGIKIGIPGGYTMTNSAMIRPADSVNGMTSVFA